MPDQWQYFHITQSIRSLNLEFYDSRPVEISSWMLALIPMPYIETIQSLGFFNRLMVTILIIWLYKSRNLRGWPLFIYDFLSKLIALQFIGSERYTSIGIYGFIGSIFHRK